MARANSIVDDFNNLQEKDQEVDIQLPEKCIACKMKIICAPLANIANMSSVGIILSVEKCQFYAPAVEQKS
jgi:hypothetical protein